MDFNSFKNPDSILRPAPFWAINDRVTPEETARQMEDMIRVGLSGGFFHSRAGLITDYLSEEWFQCMEAALDVAKAKDGYLWLYDEDLWPSGNAGGLVAAMNDEFRSATLQAEFIGAGQTALPHEEDEPKAAYIVLGRQGATIEGFRRIEPEEVDNCMEEERVLFRRCYMPKTPWWGGESYANLLNPEAIRNFIEMTHEVYRKRLGDDFAGRIPGIFTDEPQLSQGSNALPWWEGIPKVYSEWNDGRDFWSDLPWLFFDGPECRRIRLIAHRTFLRQFCEAFSRPIYEWCEANRLEHTGHYNAEDAFEGQIRCHCGGIMAHYRYQQAPGIDHLCREVDGLLLTVKQVGSAARQLGRKRVLTEIFGVSRHTNTFEDFKWLGDYDLVLGANFFCPHLTWYSMRGRRKRDYPPNWNYQQTYWNDLKPLNDYFTRLAAALTMGEGAPDALVLHPIETGTSGHRFGFTPPRGVGRTKYQYTVDGRRRALPVDLPGEDMHDAHWADQLLRRTLESLLNSGFDCDLGDEGYIEDMGSVRDGVFTVGKMNYGLVVIPPSNTWRPRTFQLLKEFVASGGKVIMAGTLPGELDCIPANEDWKQFSGLPGVETVPCSAVQIRDAADRAIRPNIMVRSRDGRPMPGFHCQKRKVGDENLVFAVNSDRNRTHECTLHLSGSLHGKPVAIWDPLSGERIRAACITAGKETRVDFTLSPAGSILFAIGQSQADANEASSKSCGVPERILPLENAWNITLSEPNVLVLDRITASPDGGDTWWEEDLEHRVRHRLANYFGTTDALLWQPWVAIRKGIFNGKGGPVILRYRFLSTQEHPETFLIMEDIHKFRVTVNGMALDVSSPDWHWDRGFGKVEISGLVRKGENRIEAWVDYDFLTEIEPAYLVGNFGVELKNPTTPQIIPASCSLKNGSWIDQGFPFYSGIVTYKTSLEIKEPSLNKQIFLKLNNPSGILYHVRVNGKDAGSIFWRPYQLDISGMLQQGENRIEIDLVSSRQNTFGPLHEREGDDFRWCGPNAFEDDGIIREEFSLYDYGLLNGAEILIFS